MSGCFACSSRIAESLARKRPSSVARVNFFGGAAAAGAAGGAVAARDTTGPLEAEEDGNRAEPEGGEDSEEVDADVAFIGVVASSLPPAAALLPPPPLLLLPLVVVIERRTALYTGKLHLLFSFSPLPDIIFSLAANQLSPAPPLPVQLFILRTARRRGIEIKKRRLEDASAFWILILRDLDKILYLTTLNGT